MLIKIDRLSTIGFIEIEEFDIYIPYTIDIKMSDNNTYYFCTEKVNGVTRNKLISNIKNLLDLDIRDLDIYLKMIENLDIVCKIKKYKDYNIIYVYSYGYYIN